MTRSVGPSVRVLIIDDDPDLRSLLARYIKQLGGCRSR